MGAAAGVEPLGERLIGGAQMDDIGQGIDDLALAQRACRPVGEAHGFVDARPGELGGQSLVADGVAEAADHGRDLGVEERAGDPAQHMIENLQVLAGGVEDLEQLRVGQQVEEGREVDAGGERVNGRGVIGPCHLDHAELRPIGPLAHELGVDGDEVGLGDAGAKRRKLVGVGNQ